ncbi:PEP-CTERM sorting domain-containing protein [Pseudoduganella dura]|nr:PEP-CTERM sorting domain-containing protein [Pseudoduganella dura]GGX98912.1 hypothetical protein GCM10007386_32250 [Pseudoduganella dura]
MIAGILLSNLLVGAPLAHAAQELNPTGFTLALTEALYPSEFDMRVLSDNGGTVQIALPGAIPITSPVQSASHGTEYLNGDDTWAKLGGAVREGYRITSVTLSGVLSGAFDIGQPDRVCGTGCTGTAGVAGNAARIDWTIGNHGATTSLPTRYTDITSPQAFSSTFTGQVEGDFTLDVSSALEAYALSANQLVHHLSGDFEWYEQLYWETTSSIALSDLTLTVQVSAVPEPGTYAMVLAGLGLMGFAARRREAMRGDN